MTRSARHLLVATGNLLLLASLAGAGLLLANPLELGAGQGQPPDTALEVPAERALLDNAPAGASRRSGRAIAPGASGLVPAPGPGAALEDLPADQPLRPASLGRAPRLPITRVVAPRIRLDAEVVASRLVEKDGGTTWEVPKYKAGHAERTAGAGQPGNAVLLGHVDSLNSGNVFKDLDQVQVGDLVQVYSGPRRFDYTVVDRRSVQRTDVSVLAATATASVSLLTCIGTWNPLIWDYTERLVVRAEAQAPAP